MTRSQSFELVEVVLDVAGRDEPRVVLVEERGGARLERLLEAAGGERVALGLVLLVRVRQVRRDDVEEKDLEPGVGEVGGDAAAHDSGSDDGGTTNRLRCIAARIRPRQAARKARRPCRRVRATLRRPRAHIYASATGSRGGRGRAGT